MRVTGASRGILDVVARTLVILAILGGCGRLGFDATGGSGGVGDAGGVDADGGTTSDPAVGFWVVTQGTLDGENQPRLRADLVNGLRADMVIEPGGFRSRFNKLSGGVTAGHAAIAGSIATSADSWVLAYDDRVVVLDLEWLGPDEVRFTADPSDPRSVGGMPPVTTATLERAEPPSEVFFGNWELAAAEYPGSGEFVAGACAPDGAGGSFRLTATATTDSHFITTARFEFDFYATAGCSGALTQTVDTGVSFGEYSAGGLLSWTDFDQLGKVVMSGPATMTPTGYRFTIAGCTPASPCQDAPRMLEFRRP